VQFDPQGRFVNNVVYGDAVRAPTALAADTNGQVYICDDIPEGPRIRSFDKEGNLLRDYPIPSWLSPANVLVDQNGTLWVDGSGFYPGAPFIEDTIYGWAAVSLGNATTVFAEGDRESKVVPGHVCDNGKTVIT
jgi:hypothetical protein